MTGGRISTLDGWRGIAILMVLASHLLGTLRLSWLIGSFANMGQHGVTIFFVLSGFLVTWTLLRDNEEVPRPLRYFYIKRFFRLLPTTWVYLLFIFLVSSTLLTLQEVKGCLFFFRNFQRYSGHYMTMHFWSLSIEEQFYLLWPPVLVGLGRRKAAVMAGVGTLSISIYRFANWGFYDRDYWRYRTEVRADALLIGCLTALLFFAPATKPVVKRYIHRLAIPASAVLGYCIWRFVLTPMVESAAIAVLILISVEAADSSVLIPLRNPVLTWIGRISYSLYMWNDFFLDLMHPGNPVKAAMILVLLFGAANANYYLIERPGTLLGRSLSNPGVRK